MELHPYPSDCNVSPLRYSLDLDNFAQWVNSEYPTVWKCLCKVFSAGREKSEIDDLLTEGRVQSVVHTHSPLTNPYSISHTFSVLVLSPFLRFVCCLEEIVSSFCLPSCISYLFLILFVWGTWFTATDFKFKAISFWWSALVLYDLLWLYKETYQVFWWPGLSAKEETKLQIWSLASIYFNSSAYTCDAIYFFCFFFLNFWIE